jgi:hypothetical protein
MFDLSRSFNARQNNSDTHASLSSQDTREKLSFRLDPELVSIANVILRGTDHAAG